MPEEEPETSTVDNRDPRLTPPGFSDVLRAEKRITGHSHRTPVMTGAQIDDRVGAQLFFMCGNFHKTGGNIDLDQLPWTLN